MSRLHLLYFVNGCLFHGAMHGINKLKICWKRRCIGSLDSLYQLQLSSSAFLFSISLFSLFCIIPFLFSASPFCLIDLHLASCAALLVLSSFLIFDLPASVSCCHHESSSRQQHSPSHPSILIHLEEPCSISSSVFSVTAEYSFDLLEPFISTNSGHQSILLQPSIPIANSYLRHSTASSEIFRAA